MAEAKRDQNQIVTLMGVTDDGNLTPVNLVVDPTTGRLKVSAVLSGTDIDHGNLTGLTDDDHSQYPLLVGRSGGQTLVGGSAVTDTLKLQGTSGNGTLTSPAIQGLVGNNGATVAYTVLNNGNVGIGTTSPGAKLHSYSLNDYDALKLERGAAGGGTAILFENGDNEQARVWLDGAQALRFDVGSAIGTDTKVLIQNNGNVGIGTTAPGAKLHLPAGVASASGSSLKITAGVGLTTPEAGAIFFDGTDLFIDI